MNKKDYWQVTNLELSEKLNSLEIKQDSLWYWTCKSHAMDGRWFIVDEDFDIEKNNRISAFTVAELGKMLPENYWSKSGGTLSALTIGKADNKWWISYNDEFIQSDTLTNAIAKMLIYLKETKNEKVL